MSEGLQRRKPFVEELPKAAHKDAVLPMRELGGRKTAGATRLPYNRRYK